MNGSVDGNTVRSLIILTERLIKFKELLTIINHIYETIGKSSILLNTLIRFMQYFFYRDGAIKKYLAECWRVLSKDMVKRLLKIPIILCCILSSWNQRQLIKAIHWKVHICGVSNCHEIENKSSSFTRDHRAPSFSPFDNNIINTW